MGLAISGVFLKPQLLELHDYLKVSAFLLCSPCDFQEKTENLNAKRSKVTIEKIKNLETAILNVLWLLQRPFKGM